ncbi:sodium:calcium antiporter [Halobacteriales archaeon QS_8_69_26]|nr:MAG: sodium:calcium antiporter [Halobacteriales archaeon QS_8_69_26]
MVQGGPAVQVGVIVASVLGPWIGARLLVGAVVRLARRFGLSDLATGLTVVAMGTSTPELAVSVDAALKGPGDIAVANVLGSNVYNLAFVLGVVAFLKVIPVAESLLHCDGLALLASTLVAGLAILDLRVTRLEGAFLALAFVAYTAYLLRTTRTEEERTGAEASPDAVTREVTERPSVRGRDVALLLGGLALVLVSGDYTVLAASDLARSAGVSERVIGGTVVAAGTSTPEFAVSLVAPGRGSLGVSVGNVVGSNVFNVTGILGVGAVVRPLATAGTPFVTLGWLAVLSLAVVAALWTGRVLSRVEGGLLAASEVVRWVLGLLGLTG